MGRLITIDDRNASDFGAGKKQVEINGHVRMLNAKVEKPRYSCSRTTLTEASIEVFDEKECKERIASKKASRSGLMPVMYKEKNPDQNGYGQCWLYCACIAFWMKTKLQGGKPRFLSPNALAFDIGEGNWGVNGGDPSDSVKTLMDKGGVRASIWPDDGSGHSTKYNTSQAKADHENNKVIVCVELDGGQAGYLQQVSCVIQDIPLVCTWNWWGHATSGCWADVVGGEIQFGIWNSWGGDWSDNGFGLLAGSKKYSDSTFAFVEVEQSTAEPA